MSGGALQLLDINKTFGVNQVLFDVSLVLKPGTVHALVGENGAGKSTLMNIAAGIYHKDSGNTVIGNEEVDIHTPKKSQSHGIMLMHQEISLFPEMTIAENIYSGRLPKKHNLFIDWKSMFDSADAILKDLECGFHSRQLVKELSVANRHLCEFARFLSVNSKFIILDEPTAALTEREKEIIFSSIRKLKDDFNIGILYISHRLHEIFEIADEVSILRDGQMQGTFDIKDISEEKITELMIGRTLEKIVKDGSENTHIDYTVAPVIELKNLSYKHIFQHISFSIRSGEILGMAGLLGSRRTEIAEAVFGVIKPTSGRILLHGKEIFNKDVTEAIENDIALVPSDRKLQGLILGMDCAKNMSLSVLSDVSYHKILSMKKESDLFYKNKDILSLKAQGPSQEIGSLSGGNQQKVVLAKWLSSSPSLLILNEPTRGIDVGAKAEIYKLIRALSKKGFAIFLITSDMFELLTLSNRVISVYEGEITGEFYGDEIVEDNIISAISSYRKIHAHG